jgi:hypothetical protein
MGMIMKSKRTSCRSSLRAGIRPTGRAGEGFAWLIFDAGGDLFQYQCYWMGGHCDDHLIEHARMATDAEAVGWAAARTARARIRMPDHRTYWAGSAPCPNGFAGIWRAPVQTSNPDRVPVSVLV